MKEIKSCETKFNVLYEDGTYKLVEEGILFEFQGNNIIFHNGTNRIEALLTIPEVVEEVLINIGLYDHYKKIRGITNTGWHQIATYDPKEKDVLIKFPGGTKEIGHLDENGLCYIKCYTKAGQIYKIVPPGRPQPELWTHIP